MEIERFFLLMPLIAIQRNINQIVKCLNKIHGNYTQVGNVLIGMNPNL